MSFRSLNSGNDLMSLLPSTVSLLLSLTVLYFLLRLFILSRQFFADLSQTKSSISLLSATSRSTILSHMASRLFQFTAAKGKASSLLCRRLAFKALQLPYLHYHIIRENEYTLAYAALSLRLTQQTSYPNSSSTPLPL